jgi:hypothetical protein
MQSAGHSPLSHGPDALLYRKDRENPRNYDEAGTGHPGSPPQTPPWGASRAPKRRISRPKEDSTHKCTRNRLRRLVLSVSNSLAARPEWCSATPLSAPWYQTFLKQVEAKSTKAPPFGHPRLPEAENTDDPAPGALPLFSQIFSRNVSCTRHGRPQSAKAERVAMAQSADEARVTDDWRICDGGPLCSAIAFASRSETSLWARRR